MKSTNKNKIKLGKAELPEGAMDTKNHKVKITTWIDGDVLERIRIEAKKTPGGKYQSLINDVLRRHVESGSNLEERLERLEKALFKNKAV